MSPVIAMHEVAPLEQAVQEIHKHFGAAIDSDNKAHGHRIKAGQKLNKLRERIESGEAGPEWVDDWWGWYGVNFVRSRKDAEKVMRMAREDDPEAAAEEERAAARERMKRSRAGDGANVRSNDADPEASAEARKAEYAAAESESGCAISADDSAPTPAARAEVARLIRAWVQASPEAKRQFIRERWDEIARSRKQLDANGADAEDRWIEGDTL
jgi:hypothetical protein